MLRFAATALLLTSTAPFTGAQGFGFDYIGPDPSAVDGGFFAQSMSAVEAPPHEVTAAQPWTPPCNVGLVGIEFVWGQDISSSLDPFAVIEWHVCVWDSFDAYASNLGFGNVHNFTVEDPTSAVSPWGNHHSGGVNQLVSIDLPGLPLEGGKQYFLAARALNNSGDNGWGGIAQSCLGAESGYVGGCLTSSNCVVPYPLDGCIVCPPVCGSGALAYRVSAEPSGVYGAGCAGGAGLSPALSFSGACTAGSALTFEVSDGLPNSVAFLGVGSGQAALPLGGGCSLLVANFSPNLLGPLPVSPLGGASLASTVPGVAAPTQLNLQAFVLDAGASLGFSTSNGLELTLLP